MTSNAAHPQTLALHAGYRADPATGSVAVPIYQTTSYQFQSTEHASNLFALKELGNIYTRIMNPTCAVLEDRITALEGGSGALAVASGQAASAIALQNLARTGDNVVSSTDLYGGTWNLFSNTLRDQGIEVRFVDPADPEAFARATDDRTRAYYAETLPNPKLQVFPIAEVAAIGRSFGIPLIVDNTAAPLLCRPFDYGAAVIVYSTTKYIGGHGTSIGGLIVDGGNFPWAEFPERQPALNTPDPSYHGAVWVEAVEPIGPVAYIIKAPDHASARPRSRVLAVQRLPGDPGSRDPAAAHLRALPQRGRGGGFPVLSSRGRYGHLPGAAGWRGAPARGRLPVGWIPAASWASNLPAGGVRGAPSSMRWNCSTTWPTSGMRARSPSIPPPRPTASFRRRTSS